MLLSLEAVTSGLQKPASLSISDALSRWLTTLSKSESKANPSFAISEMEINYLSFLLFFFLTPPLLLSLPPYGNPFNKFYYFVQLSINIKQTFGWANEADLARLHSDSSCCQPAQ